MSRTRSLRQSPPDVQSWVDNISLGAIGQSNQDGETPQEPSNSDLYDNALALSPSRNGSNSSIDQSHPPVSSAIQAMRPTPSVSGPMDTLAHAAVSSRSRLPQSVVDNDRLDLGNSGTLRGKDSLLQLKTAGVPYEAQLSLPSSRSSSVSSSATAIGTQRIASSLEQLSQLQAIEPHNVPLPDDAELSILQSHASSRDSTSGVGNGYAFNNSLEQLHNLHPANPSDVPLPASNGSGSVNTITTPNVASHYGLPRFLDAGKRDYWQKIEPLTHFLPHLKAMSRPKGRHRRTGKVTCIDYLRNGDSQVGITIDMSHVRSRSRRKTVTDQLKDLRVVNDPSVCSRMILVEDLCSKSIELLGTTFELDPEFFAEHLNRSGYDGEDYSEADAERWNTAHLEKDFVAMTWCRPLYQNPQLTEWLRAPRKLLNKDPDRLAGMSGVTWRDPIFTAMGKRNRLASEHQLRVDTNIFRRSWPLSAGTADLNGQLRFTERRSQKPLGELRPTLVPTAWQERASFCRIQEDPDIPIGILLLDPLPKITDIRSPLYPQTRPDVVQNSASSLSQWSSASTGTEVEVEIALPMAPRLLHNAALNKYKAPEAELGRLEASFTELHPTSWSIQTANHLTSQTPCRGTLHDPIIILLRIVEHDTRVFLRSLEWALDDICNDSLDEFLLTRRLSDWRKLMSEFEKEIPAISTRLEHFVDFVTGAKGSNQLPNEVNEIVQTVRDNVTRVKTRLDEAYADLRVDMQFNESRRSMNETQTVTRLTELAFVFIPLSFCASLFSMSIRELGDGVPVWIFIITSLVMVSIAYGVRILVGSELLSNSIRRSFERFWEITGVKPSDSDKAPMFTIVRFTVQEIWKSVRATLLIGTAGSIALTAPLVIPIVFMWTSTNMGKGFKSVITLFLLTSVATALLMTLNFKKYGLVTGLRNRQVMGGSVA